VSVAGPASIGHLDGILADCSSRRDTLAAKRRASMDSGREFKEILPSIAALAKEARDSYDEAAATEPFVRFKANGTWQCPTLTVLRMLTSLDDDVFRANPRLNYVDAVTRVR
jgi:hypothetical protein